MRSPYPAADKNWAPVYGMFQFDRIYSLISDEIGRESACELKSPEMTLNEAYTRLAGTGDNTMPGIPAIYADKNAVYNKQVRRAALEYLVAAWRYAIGEQRLVATPSDEAKHSCSDLAHRIKNLLEAWDDNDERKRQLLGELEREGAVQ